MKNKKISTLWVLLTAMVIVVYGAIKIQNPFTFVGFVSLLSFFTLVAFLLLCDVENDKFFKWLNKKLF